MFSFLSGIYIYVIAWGLFGQDNSDTLGPQSLPDFAVNAASLITLCYDKLYKQAEAQYNDIKKKRN